MRRHDDARQLRIVASPIRYPEHMVPAGDAQLVQIVDAATADAARRAGSWLHCAPGCTQCCIGVFAISQLDAARLRDGLATLEQTNPPRAAAVRERALQAVDKLTAEFPGDPQTGLLDEQRGEAFENFANDEPCPALDPASGLCDLYAARPITCRVFGLPLRTGDGLGVCELCFVGAADAEIAASELRTGSEDLEAALTAQAETAVGLCGSTIVAWALVRP
jgi:Fe-S-cluster containining protein